MYLLYLFPKNSLDLFFSSFGLTLARHKEKPRPRCRPAPPRPAPPPPTPQGLRYIDEFVRHKILDCIGDLALAGAPIFGHLLTHKPGHRLNNALLRERSRPQMPDVFSSGVYFDGWETPPEVKPPPGTPPVALPRTRMLKSGWRRYGLIGLDEVPDELPDRSPPRRRPPA